MDHVMRLRIEPISRIHDRASFSCGIPALDEYLHRYARQNDEKNIARTFVAVNGDNRVLGYHSVSATRIEFEALPADLHRRLPHYPVPAALIARLAVDTTVADQELGARLLIDALRRILNASSEMAVKVVVVDAMNEQAKAFYRHFGFVPIPGQDLQLFLPIETVAQLF